jgi:hypothetical protein
MLCALEITYWALKGELLDIKMCILCCNNVVTYADLNGSQVFKLRKLNKETAKALVTL